MDDSSPTEERREETPEERRERMRELGRKGGIARQAKAREEREARQAAGLPPTGGKAPAALTDEELARSVLRSVATDGKASDTARAQAARTLLGVDADEDVVGLPPSLFAALPAPWLALVIEHEPADLAAVIALLVEHELAKRLTPEPEPAAALA